VTSAGGFEPPDAVGRASRAGFAAVTGPPGRRAGPGRPAEVPPRLRGRREQPCSPGAVASLKPLQKGERGGRLKAVKVSR